MRCRLLTMLELEGELNREFAPLEPDLMGLRLVRPGTSHVEVGVLQALLGVQFPASFTTTMTTFNLGSLTIGPTVFGHEVEYSRVLREANLEPVVPWWGVGERPASTVMFGNSDPYALVLDCTRGDVLAIQHGGGGGGLVVASDFELFLRGIGTVFVGRQTERAEPDIGPVVGALVGSSSEGLAYWSELAR